MKKKIAIGSDHAGFNLKEFIRQKLEERSYTVLDSGVYEEKRADYPDIADKVCDTMLTQNVELGVLVCGTGIGISIAANRHKGIRAALCMNTDMASICKAHNNSNVLVLGGRTIPEQDAEKILEVWLTTEFEGGRHTDRIEKLDK